jgi:hypothetical protein
MLSRRNWKRKQACDCAEGFAVVATSITSVTTLAALTFNRRDGTMPIMRELLLAAQRGLTFVVNCSQVKELAPAHLTVGAPDGSTGCQDVTRRSCILPLSSRTMSDSYICPRGPRMAARL